MCEYAGKNPEYVYNKMIEQIQKREKEMEAVRSGNRLYVKNNNEYVISTIKQNPLEISIPNKDNMVDLY